MPPRTERGSISRETSLSQPERNQLLSALRTRVDYYQAWFDIIPDERIELARPYIPALSLGNILQDKKVRLESDQQVHLRKMLAIEIIDHLSSVDKDEAVLKALGGLEDFLDKIGQQAGTELAELENFGEVDLGKGPMEWKKANTDLNKLHRLSKRKK